MAEKLNVNGYSFEETDDSRTSSGELVPDCEKIEGPSDDEDILETEADKVLPDLLLIEYVAEFRSLIDACGQTSYYWNMKQFVAERVKKAEDIAAAYQHDARYYTEQYREWAAKAKRSYKILGMHAARLAYKMPEIKGMLNSLTLYKDRRECYRYHLDNCLKRGAALSPEELEKKYEARIAKRKQKKK